MWAIQLGVPHESGEISLSLQARGRDRECERVFGFTECKPSKLETKKISSPGGSDWPGEAIDGIDYMVVSMYFMHVINY